ncbi:MAG: hypothetical protein QXF25_01730 [Candidatus Pacearchaeota archaeon]
MEKIKAMIILEIMGRPQEYVRESAETLVKKLGEEKTIKILNSKIADTKKLEGKDLFSTFAEIELEAENLLVFVSLMFRYMPAHVEVIEPARLTMENFDINNLLNELVIRLHRYDELAKVLSIEKNILIKQLTELKKKICDKKIIPLKPSAVITKKEVQRKDKKQLKRKNLKKSK